MEDGSINCIDFTAFRNLYLVTAVCSIYADCNSDGVVTHFRRYLH